MKQIQLTNRRSHVVALALVDDGWEWLSVYRWHLLPNGYAVRSVSTPNGTRKIYLHRAVMRLDRRYRRTQVDHINGDKLDCRKSNLRTGSASQNQENRGGCVGAIYPRGVVFDKRRGCFYARCMVRGRTHNLGTFATADAAGRAAAKFRTEHMPWSPDARTAA